MRAADVRNLPVHARSGRSSSHRCSSSLAETSRQNRSGAAPDPCAHLHMPLRARTCNINSLVEFCDGTFLHFLDSSLERKPAR